MNIDTIYNTVQSQPHGSSGRGVSFWSKAARCGRLIHLELAHPQQAPEAAEDLNALRVGSFYHALHEASLAGQQSGQIWDMTDSAVADIDWLEALRLYRAYTSHWGSAAEKWRAKILSVEVKLPATDAGQALVRSLFNEDVTFRADWVGQIDDPAATYSNTGKHIPEPGIYIFDHKTAGARKAIHEWEFSFGNQATAYLHLYNLENPDAPAKGMIFDQIYKHKDISKEALLTKTGTLKREPSYEHFVTAPNEDAEKIIRALVNRGMYNLEDNGRANPEHCFSEFNPCWYFANGLCRRF